MRRNVAEEFRRGSEGGEASEDEAIDESFQPLQAVLQRQRLQVQVVVLTHLLLQELATKIHDSPDLRIDATFIIVGFGYYNTFFKSNSDVASVYLEKCNGPEVSPSPISGRVLGLLLGT